MHQEKQQARQQRCLSANRAAHVFSGWCLHNFVLGTFDSRFLLILFFRTSVSSLFRIKLYLFIIRCTIFLATKYNHNNLIQISKILNLNVKLEQDYAQLVRRQPVCKSFPQIFNKNIFLANHFLKLVSNKLFIHSPFYLTN